MAFLPQGTDALLPKRTLQSSLLATLRRLASAFGELWDGIERRHGLLGSQRRKVTDRRFATLGIALLFAIWMVSSGFAHDHAFTTIDVPGASFTQALGINPKGDVVGSYLNAAGLHGFLLSKGAFTAIDVPGASFTQALGINPKGDVVGVYSNATGTHGFLLRRRERDEDGDKDDNGPRNTERSVSRDNPGSPW